MDERAIGADVVAEEQIANYTTVRAEEARRELIAKQAELASGEVKQRADARVRLAVVVAEGALVVAPEVAPLQVHERKPVMTEALVELELDRVITAFRIHEAVGNAVGRRRVGRREVEEARATYLLALAVDEEGAGAGGRGVVRIGATRNRSLVVRWGHVARVDRLELRRSIGDLLLVDGDVSLRGGIRDTAGVVGNDGRALRRLRADVLDDAVQATIRVAGLDDHRLGKIAFDTEDVLVFILLFRSRENAFTRGRGEARRTEFRNC